MVAGCWGVNAQGGQFQFGALSAPDPGTGMQRCTVTWALHEATIATINAYISYSTSPICIDIAATKASVPAELSTYTNVTSTGISLIKVSNSPLNIAPIYPNFIVIYISGEPSESVIFSGGGFLTNPNNTSFSIGSTNPTYQFPSGYGITGVAQKLGGSACNGGSNNWIPDVQFSINRVLAPGEPACYAGPAMPASTTPVDPFYAFENLPPMFSYSLAAAKNTGCDCGPLGPINNVDKNLVRSYILGLATPTLLEGHTGDYDANGALNAYDMTFITKCNLGEPSMPSVWRFAAVSSISNFSNPLIQSVNPLPPLLPNTLTVSSLSGNSTVDFVGIKRGDVDQSCTTCGGALTGGGLEERGERKRVYKGVSVEGKSMEAGEELLIPVVATDDLTGLAIFGMELASSNKIRLMEAKDVIQTDEYSDYRIREENDGQVLHYDWFTMTNGGKKIAQGDVLFYVRVQSLDKVMNLKDELFLLPFSPNNMLFYDNGQSEADWRLTEPDKKTYDRLSAVITGGNLLMGATAQVEIYVPQSGLYQIVVSDMSGNVASTRAFDAAEKGWIKKEVSIPDHAGVYQMTISSASERHTLRLVRY